MASFAKFLSHPAVVAALSTGAAMTGRMREERERQNAFAQQLALKSFDYRMRNLDEDEEEKKRQERERTQRIQELEQGFATTTDQKARAQIADYLAQQGKPEYQARAAEARTAGQAEEQRQLYESLYKANLESNPAAAQDWGIALNNPDLVAAARDIEVEKQRQQAEQQEKYILAQIDREIDQAWSLVKTGHPDNIKQALGNLKVARQQYPQGGPQFDVAEVTIGNFTKSQSTIERKAEQEAAADQAISAAYFSKELTDDEKIIAIGKHLPKAGTAGRQIWQDFQQDIRGGGGTDEWGERLAARPRVMPAIQPPNKRPVVPPLFAAPPTDALGSQAGATFAQLQGGLGLEAGAARPPADTPAAPARQLVVPPPGAPGGMDSTSLDAAAQELVRRATMRGDTTMTLERAKQLILQASGGMR